MTLRMLERLDDKTVYLNSGPMFHIGSLRRTLAVLHAGGRNVLCRRVDARVLCELIDAEGCTHAFLQPPSMAQMVEANTDGRFDLSSLRSRPGGPPGWAEMVTVVDEPTVSSGYGQTEVAGVVTFHFPDRPATGAWPGPLANVEVRYAGRAPGRARGSRRNRRAGADGHERLPQSRHPDRAPGARRLAPHQRSGAAGG